MINRYNKIPTSGVGYAVLTIYKIKSSDCYISELFTFIRFSDISSDKNKAEQSLRHLVVSRKISGSTRSKKGSETKSILAPLFGTWRLQNLNPFEQTKLLLLKASCQES